ncbi:MAG: SurA N-terminal domain-containing protein [Patescibacteria group bacterium]
MKQPISKSLMTGIIVTLLIIIAVAGVSIWLSSAIYGHREDSRVVRIIGSWLPVARVGSKKISYGEFLDNMDTVRIYLSSEAAKDSGMAGPITPDVEKNSLDRMVRELIVKQMAEEKSVTVPDEDVRDSFANLVAMTSSTVPNVAQYLNESFHWTEEQFRAKVIYPALLEEELATTFSSSTDEQVMLLEQEIRKRLAGKDVKYYLKF